MGNMLGRPPPDTSSVDRLTVLAKQIEHNTRILTESLSVKGCEAPSFEAGGRTDFPIDSQCAETTRARQHLIAITKELHELVQGPREVLKTMAWDSISYIPLHAISDFKIAAAVPRQGTVSYAELSLEVARITGHQVVPADLRRLCRLAIANRIFQEPKVGHIAHNSTSLLFLDDQDLASWVGMFTTDLLGPVACTVEAMKKWPNSQETNETGVNVSYRHTRDFFEHLQLDPARAERYDQAMRAQSGREGWDLVHTVGSYPWARFSGGTIVDVGGNEGYAAIALANSFPTISFVVQDLPGMRTPAILQSVPSHLRDRLCLTTHDFFTPQSVHGAQAYFFRYVFHAFSDKYAIQILRNLIPAMTTGARVIINDLVLPEPGTVSKVEEKAIRTMDVLMKTVCNAREREVADWKDLFRRADDRFQWRGAWQSSGRLWFVEAVWKG